MEQATVMYLISEYLKSIQAVEGSTIEVQFVLLSTKPLPAIQDFLSIKQENQLVLEKGEEDWEVSVEYIEEFPDYGLQKFLKKQAPESIEVLFISCL